MNENLIQTFCDMVRINSESGNEKDFLSYIESLFTREFNAQCEKDKYGNLIMKIPRKNSFKEKPILFACHGDTVSPGRDIEPILKNNFIYSKGDTILGADDKAAIAELFEAIKTADQYPPLEIVISRQEEVGGQGAKNLDISLVKSKIGFVLDMDNIEDIVIGGPSYMYIKVKIIGKAAHAGMCPEKGISSIRIAAKAILKLKEGWVDDETTVNVGIIEGGSILNSVPKETVVKIECRSKSHEKCLQQTELIRKLFTEIAKENRARAEITTKLSFKAYSISEDDNLVKIAKSAIANVGLEPKVSIICGGTDAAHYFQRGIITTVIGMGSRMEHTVEEHISIEDMGKVVKILHYIFKELNKKKYINL